MLRRGNGNTVNIIIAMVIMFLFGKFLGLWKAFDIDPFGIEPEWAYGALALGIGVLYKEIRDLGKEVRTRFHDINDTSSKYGERIVKLETMAEIKKSEPFRMMLTCRVCL